MSNVSIFCHWSKLSLINYYIIILFFVEHQYQCNRTFFKFGFFSLQLFILMPLLVYALLATLKLYYIMYSLFLFFAICKFLQIKPNNFVIWCYKIHLKIIQKYYVYLFLNSFFVISFWFNHKDWFNMIIYLSTIVHVFILCINKFVIF